MNDEGFTREENDLREALTGFLERMSGALAGFTLHRAKASERGYILTADDQTAEVLAEYLNSVAGLINYGPVWVLLRSDASKIIDDWKSCRNGNKKL